MSETAAAYVRRYREKKAGKGLVEVRGFVPQWVAEKIDWLVAQKGARNRGEILEWMAENACRERQRSES